MRGLAAKPIIDIDVVIRDTSLFGDVAAALAKSYAAVRDIRWQDCYYRRDIGKDLM